MTKQLRQFFGFFLLSFFTTHACALEVVTLQLKSQHKFQFAGYYAAKAKGFYEQAGLSVVIHEATTSVDTIDIVLSNQAQYGVGSNSLLLAHQAGKPVVALGVIFQRSPLIFLAKQEGHSKSIENLTHKVIALDSQADELMAYLFKQGVDLKSLIYRPHNSTIETLIDGSIDVMSAYITYEPYLLNQRNIPYFLLSASSAGIHFYGDNLFTTRSELSANPKRVAAFREASLKGWNYALMHSEEIIDLILSDYSVTKSRGQLQYEADQIVSLIHPELVEIGYMLEARWQHIAKVYASMGMLPKLLPRQDISLANFLYNANQQKNTSIFYWTLSISLLFLVLLSFTTLYFIKSNNSLKQLLYSKNSYTNIGESIHHVTHQWKQPLNNLGILLMQLEQTIKHDTSHQEKLLDISAKCNHTLQFMADSVDSFRDLLSTQNTSTTFNPETIIDEVILLLSDSFKRRGISVTKDLISSIKISGNNTELANVLLSIFINSQDNFFKKSTIKPSLNIQLKRFNRSAIITIKDNGGGIEMKPIENIFEMGATTNREKHGGIGLYIAKRIINERFNGSICAKNYANSAHFTITLAVADT